MKLEDWNYKDRNAAGWLHMWDLTLQTVWGRTPWERAAPRNAPSRGVRPQHDLGTVDRRGGGVLPFEAYDLWVPDEHPRVTVQRWLRAGDGYVAGVLERAQGQQGYTMSDFKVAFRYPEHAGVAPDGMLAQESGNFPSPAADGARNYASMVLLEERAVVASSVDADKTSSGLLRYTTVAAAHRGRGLATALWVLTHECGIPAWRVSDEWFEMESQHNRIHVGMMRPLLKAHALCIVRAGVRGVKVADDVLASALNWESYTEDLMAKAEASKAAPRQVGAFPGWQPPTAEQKEKSAARKKARAERKAAAEAPRRTRRGARAPRPGRGVSVDAAKAVTEALQAATADARELLEESDLLTEAREVLGELRDATKAVDGVAEMMQTAAADAREVTEELAALLESLPAEAAELFASMRDAADTPSETVPESDK